MKNNFISMLAVALGAAALFTSCEKEQSVFSPESLPGTCTITGVVNYNEGYALVGDQLVSDHEVPASGQVIMLKIGNDQYSGNQYSGNQIYTDTLDAEGRYEFTIPAPANGEPLSGTLEVIPFKASYADYYPTTNQLVEYENATYNITFPNITIRDQFPVEQNLTATVTRPENDIQYNVPITINGTVYGPGWDINTSGSTSPTTGHTPSMDAPVGIDVLISIYIQDAYNTRIHYIATSDNTTGEYSATINLPENFFTQAFTANYDINPIAQVRNFTNWYQYSNLTSTNAWTSQEIELYYPSSYNAFGQIEPVNEYTPIEAVDITIYTKPITDLVYGLDRIENPGPNDPVINTPQGFVYTFEWYN